MTPPDTDHETNIKKNEGKQRASQGKSIEIVKFLPTIIVSIAGIIGGYLTEITVVMPIREPLRASQTAEAKSEMTLLTSTPLVTKVLPTVTVQPSTPIPQPTPTSIPTVASADIAFTITCANGTSHPVQSGDFIIL